MRFAGGKAMLIDLNEEMNHDDLISQLPDSILQNHIISLIPTAEAVRTSIISKRWRNLYRFLPNLDFNANLYIMTHSHILFRFREFVDQTLMSYNSDTSIQVFRIYIKLKDDVVSNRFDGWINWAITHNVQVVDLCLMFYREHDYSNKYRLPPALFTSRFITTLRLEQCVFECYGDFIGLVSLKNLYLNCVRVTNLTMHLVVTSCSVLEVMHLICCQKLTALKGRNTHIRDIVITCGNLKKFDMDVPNLKLFNLRSNENNKEFGKINWMYRSSSTIIAFRNVQTLSLHYCNIITEDLFHFLLSKCDLLENLELSHCRNLKCLKIYSRGLKSLAISYCLLDKVEIDAPNLVSLRYMGAVIDIVLMNSTCRMEINIDLTIKYPTPVLQLRNLLERFDHARALTLVVDRPAEAILLPEELLENRLPPLYDLKHLKVQTNKPRLSYTDALVRLLRLSAHLETLIIVFGYFIINLKFEPRDHKEFEGFPSPNWTHLPLKYLRNRLKEVKIRNFRGNAKELQLVNYIGGDSILLEARSFPPPTCLIWKA